MTVLFDSAGRIIEPGAIVTWKSQAQGVWKEKVGEVIAIVPPGASVTKIALSQGCDFYKLRYDPHYSHRKLWSSDVHRTATRVLVRCARRHKRTNALIGWDYYCPYYGVVRVIRRANDVGGDGLADNAE